MYTQLTQEERYQIQTLMKAGNRAQGHPSFFLCIFHISYIYRKVVGWWCGRDLIHHVTNKTTVISTMINYMQYHISS